MRVSDYIVSFLEERGVRHLFGYPGGMSTYLMESLSGSGKIQVHLAYHEQAAAFEAVGYAQMVQEPVAVFTSSGPGATNLITGICDAWFDSVPVLFITGNVNTYESRGAHSVRQKGFQETDIVHMIDEVTKFSCMISDPTDIRQALEKAFYEMTEGRPGPCLLDIPMDITRAEVIPEQLVGFKSGKEGTPQKKLVCAAETILKKMRGARRPVLLLGNGIHTAHVEKEVCALAGKWGIPVVSSLPAFDLLAFCAPYSIGFIGAYGKRAANIVLEKSDLVISVGSRLDNRQTGTDVSWFATKAELIRLDIDEEELKLTIKEGETQYRCDLAEILPVLLEKEFSREYQEWLTVCRKIEEKLDSYDQNEPVEFLKELFSYLPEESVITTDVGQNQIWVPQAMDIRKKVRILFSAGLGSMGYSLPAAIGAQIASGKPVFCFNGDGGVQMNIQEMQFIAREKIPVKIIVLNNHSLGMIRQFQELYFDSNHFMTTEGCGYSAPDFSAIAQAYGIPARNVSLNEAKTCAEFLMCHDHCLINVDMGNRTYLKPKSLYNKPLAYQIPSLPEELQDELMEM